eukprot:scaffold30163_cov28-Attheya_sp.AAC.1
MNGITLYMAWKTRNIPTDDDAGIWVFGSIFLTAELWLFGYPLVLMLVDFNPDAAFFGRVMIKPGISITSTMLIIAPLILKKSTYNALINQQTGRQRRNSGQLRLSQNTAEDTNSTLARLSSKKIRTTDNAAFKTAEKKRADTVTLSRVPSKRST